MLSSFLWPNRSWHGDTRYRRVADVERWVSATLGLNPSGFTRQCFGALVFTFVGALELHRPLSGEVIPRNDCQGEIEMARILLIGQEPESVDFSDPAMPPGLTVEKIHAGVALALRQMSERGWTVDHCLIKPDGTAGDDIRSILAAETYDCVVIGGGIRIPPPSLFLFETVLNAVHTGAPGATIAFNTIPENSADAAERWLAKP